jgi:hypothetical protein
MHAACVPSSAEAQNGPVTCASGVRGAGNTAPVEGGTLMCVRWFRARRDPWFAQQAAVSLAETFRVRALPRDGIVIVSIKDDETERWAETAFGTGDIDLVVAVLRQAQVRAEHSLTKRSSNC